MLSRLASALYSAVDVIAPPLPLKDDFQWHWNSITKFYTERTSSGQAPVEMTHIPRHFLRMSEILEQEEEEDPTGMGACMEYVIQERLLDSMFLLARADTPPGIKSEILNFVARLLTNSSQSLLPQTGICSPILKFVKLCGETRAAPTEKDEMDFLDAVCSKIKDNPQFVNFFLSSTNDDSTKAISSSSFATCSSNGRTEHCPKSVLYYYPLMESLLILLKSPDNEIVIRAGNCIHSCVLTATDNGAIAVINQTTFCYTIINCLTSLFSAIPKNLKPIDVDNAYARWSQDILSHHDTHISFDQRKLLCFLRWFDFVNMLIEQAHTLIGEKLLSTFKTEFLDSIVYNNLIEDEDEVTALFMTTFVSSCLRHTTSEKVADAISDMLIGSENEPEIPDHVGHVLKHLLIEHCKSTQFPQLSMVTLQLFEELLQKPTVHIMQNLVLCNLESRSYIDRTATDSCFNYFDCDLESPENHLSDDVSLDSSDSSLLPTYIHKIINCFLILVPDEIKSCDSEDSGYSSYIQDAHNRYLSLLNHYPDQSINLLSEAEDGSSSDSQPEADSTGFFYEGALLSMILDKVEQMLHQPYEVNLQVTSLLSRLALFPHPNLHEYLLNPITPLMPGSRSLFSVLLKVVRDIQDIVQKVPDYKNKLKLTRRILLSEDGENDVIEDGNIFEALIVIEEFCKELAAIAFVKYHSTS